MTLSISVPRTSTNFTSSTPSDSCPSPLDWDPRNLMFPNDSAPLDPVDNITSLSEVEGILSNIIEEGLDDLNITEMALNDGM